MKTPRSSLRRLALRHLAASIRIAALPCLLATPILAQTTPASRPDYSRESSIIEHVDRVYRYAADGTGAKDITTVIDIRDQAAVKSWSVINVSFASSSEHVEIDYVRIRRPDGTVIPTPAADAQELPAPVTREAPFYSDLKEKQIPIRSLSPGDHLEYHFRVIRNHPEAPGHFWDQENFITPSAGTVVLSETLELHVPKDAYVHLWSPKYKSTLTDTATEHVYRWESSQPLPVAGKDHSALLRMEQDPTVADDSIPHLPHVAWTNFHNWAEVGAWYRSMEGHRAEPDDDIRSKVKDLIAGKTTDEDKARAIYAFVGPQIRYIGVAFGIGRYQPHEAGEILRNQYGDCKDKTTLLISMLSAAGITSDAVLIGAGVAFNQDVPSPGSFNHAINLVHIDGKPVWLDATAEIAPYRMLEFQIRGHQALVIPLTGDAHIETTPKDPPFPSVVHFDAIGSLDDKGTSHSHMVMDLRGDPELPFRAAVLQVSPAQWDELMQHISQAMGYIGKVTNAQFSRPDNTDDPFHIAYDYEREKSGDWDNLRILSQLIPASLGDVDEKDPPLGPIELGAPHVEISHAAMKLPPGWTAELPPPIHAKSAYATLDKTYKFENGTLITDRRIEILADKVPATDWLTYHKWFSDAGLDSEPFIQLYNPSSPKPGPSAGSNPAARELARQASEANLAKDWPTARHLLDEAKAINPHEPYLWSEYAYILINTGKVDEGIVDLKREIAEHPDEPYTYRLLASTYLWRKKSDEAIAVLQSEVDRNPADADTILYLVSILIQHNRYADAERVLRAGLLAAPNNLNLKMQLGLALLRDHKQDEGEPILRDVATNSDDPFQLNNAAYELGEASLDLPLAEKASRRSLDLLDQATSAASADTVADKAALQRCTTLIASWDTLGWILFREDKFAEAEPWLRAAWRNSPTAIGGYHLGMVLQKQHRDADALAQFQLAAASSGDDATQALIAAKVSELVASGQSGHVKDAAAQLQQYRTYKIARDPDINAKSGWATVELDVTAKGTTAARWVDGDKSMVPLPNALTHFDLDLKIPPQSNATLIRRAVLSCTARTECQLVLIPPTDAPTQ
jgi:predicted Zn-dependent protease/transglutaminase-like putative cysteine protease